jgi:hypothetical protein
MPHTVGMEVRRKVRMGGSGEPLQPPTSRALVRTRNDEYRAGQDDRPAKELAPALLRAWEELVICMEGPRIRDGPLVLEELRPRTLDGLAALATAPQLLRPARH